MTLNGHFALKSGPSSASNGLPFWLSEKTIRKFAELRIDCQRQKTEPTHGTGDVSVIGLITGVPQRGSIKPVNCIHTQFSHMLFTDIEKSKITMLEFGSRQSMTDMDTKRARGKCIANALVCQLC